MRLVWKNRCVEFPRRPLIMGIVNVNDDSFSGDGSLVKEEIVEVIRDQIRQGADVIDIGAESARTNRAAISEDEELRRFAMIFAEKNQWLENVQPRDEVQIFPPILSANTWRSGVVAGVLEMGAEWINDMSGLPNAENAKLCAEHDAALLIMHSVGEPKVPHFHQQWDDVMTAILDFFTDKIQIAINAGLPAEAILLDPGIDFAKQRDDNLTVLSRLHELQSFLRPVLVPVSRKTVIGEVLSQSDPRERDAGTVALIASSMSRGAQIFRVHHVDAAWQAIKVLHGLSGKV